MDITKLFHHGSRRGLIKDLLGEEFSKLEKRVNMGTVWNYEKALYFFAVSEIDLVCSGHAGEYALFSRSGLYNLSKNKRDLLSSFNLQNKDHFESYFLGVIGGDPSGENEDYFQIGNR